MLPNDIPMNGASPMSMPKEQKLVPQKTNPANISGVIITQKYQTQTNIKANPAKSRIGSIILIRFFTFQETVKCTYFCLVVVISFYGVVTVKTFNIGNGIV